MEKMKKSHKSHYQTKVNILDRIFQNWIYYVI